MTIWEEGWCWEKIFCRGIKKKKELYPCEERKKKWRRMKKCVVKKKKKWLKNHKFKGIVVQWKREKKKIWSEEGSGKQVWGNYINEVLSWVV